MKNHQLLMIISQTYLAAAFVVEGMSFAATVVGAIFGLAAILGVWRE